MGHLPAVHVLWELDASSFGDWAPLSLYIIVNVARFRKIWTAGHHHGESLFAAVAILQQSDSVKKMLVACLSVYYALLIKLLYFELQSCVAKHAINVNALRSIMWTLAHLPLYISSAAGAGAVLHWAATVISGS